MTIDRRNFIAATAAGTALAGSGAALAQPGSMRRIAVEEAWSFPELMAMNRDIAIAGGDNLDLVQLRPPPGANPAGSNPLTDNLFDTDRRLEEMDRLGIDMHLLSLTSPGVQLLPRADAVRMASVANDALARIVADRPARFGGLASFSPQDPAAAAREMERAINALGLHGFIVNSHTDNLYLDDPRIRSEFSKPPRRSIGRSISIRAARPTVSPAPSATTACGLRSGDTPSRPAPTPCA